MSLRRCLSLSLGIVAGLAAQAGPVQAINLSSPFYKWGKACPSLGKKFEFRSDIEAAVKICTRYLWKPKKGARINEEERNYLSLAYQCTAIWYDRIQDYAGEAKVLTDLLTIDPDDLPARRSRGFAYLHNGEAEPAIADFTEVLKFWPSHGYVSFWRGQAYEKLAAEQEAIADYGKAIESIPQYAQAYVARAKLLEKRKDVAGALADYRGAAASTLTEGTPADIKPGFEEAQAFARVRLAILGAGTGQAAEGAVSNEAAGQNSQE